jgi:hypothetical protein
MSQTNGRPGGSTLGGRFDVLSAMRLILDTNQVSAFVRGNGGVAPSRSAGTVILAPAVMAEVCLSEFPQERLQRLSRYSLRFGLEYPEIMSEVARLTEKQIRTFDPLVLAGTARHELYRVELMKPPLQRAKSYIDGCRRILKDKRSRLAQFRRANTDALSRGERMEECKGITDIQHAMSMFARDVDMPIPAGIVRSVVHAGGGSMRANTFSGLWQAILKNPQLLRFYRAMLALHLGYGHAWKDDRLNIDPSERRNDITDILLLLYAADGDTILTEDKKLTRLLRCIDVESRVVARKHEPQIPVS